MAVIWETAPKQWRRHSDNSNVQLTSTELLGTY